ncbi:QDE-2-interacting protein [Paecilomyces variotii No. 5]|uniref:QDE-2-interacting protein n=1 Tax=Byssochlamys spectabilis (strain No. 5 / NBRC 109023) TaxID=1356009 RepID=V5I1Q8_BYSSN|nr:QDE-2-interacting protein [Paecilomyces variotii No. 5]
MDRAERLKLLFEDDKSLLTTDTKLYEEPLPNPPAPVPERLSSPVLEPAPAPRTEKAQPEQDASSNTVAKEPFGPEPPPVVSDSEESDDYLSACKRTAQRKVKEAVQTASLQPSKKDAKKSHGRKIAAQNLDITGSLSNVPLSRCFCPIMAVSRLPYKYLRGEASEAIAQQFFTDGKFWMRYWNLYYINPPPYLSTRPLLLVPAIQVQELVDEINDKFNCALSLPTDVHLGLVLPFEEDGTPQPQFLGQCTSREMKDKLEYNASTASGGRNDHNAPAGCTPEVDRSFAAFRKKIEAALEATKNRTKASKAKKRQNQIEKRQEWSGTLRRTQRYLGLRPLRPRGLLPPDLDDNASWEEKQRAEHEYGLACGTILEPLNMEEPAPFPPSDEPVFICVDVESNERCHDQITEVGVSVLDTLDLVGVPPGEGGKNWIARIRSRHFRVQERSYIVNKDFIAGCPDKFEFGESEWVSIGDIVRVVDKCFQPPYSGHIELTVGENAGKDGRSDVVVEGGLPEYKLCPRNIVFLGHDTQTDIKYLRTLGSTLFKDCSETPEGSAEDGQKVVQPSFLEALDTATLFRVLKRDTNPRSLGQVLLDLGITGWNLHNAGNDARYTVEAMIGIVLKSRLLLDQAAQAASTTPIAQCQPQKISTSPEEAWKEEVERRVSKSVAETEKRVREDCEGWEFDSWTTEDIDGGDGCGHGIPDYRGKQAEVQILTTQLEATLI